LLGLFPLLKIPLTKTTLNFIEHNDADVDYHRDRCVDYKRKRTKRPYHNYGNVAGFPDEVASRVFRKKANLKLTENEGKIKSTLVQRRDTNCAQHENRFGLLRWCVEGNCDWRMKDKTNKAAKAKAISKYYRQILTKKSKAKKPASISASTKSATAPVQSSSSAKPALTSAKLASTSATSASTIAAPTQLPK
jgi:hypothetical protein